MGEDNVSDADREPADNWHLHAFIPGEPGDCNCQATGEDIPHTLDDCRAAVARADGPEWLAELTQRLDVIIELLQR